MNRSTLLFCIISFASCGGNEITPSIGWEKIGLDQKQVRTVVSYNNKLYAATFGAGIYYSDDQGATWITLNNGLADLNVYTVILKGDTLLAGTRSGVFIKPGSENSWKLFSTSFPNETRAYSLYTYREALYIGSRTAVFRIPYNNPGTHAILNTGFPEEPYVISLQGHDNKLFAGTQEGLYIWSVNQWEPQSGIPKSTVGRIGFANDEIYAPTDGEGIFRFATGTWARLNDGLSSLKAFVALVNGDVVYCGTSEGVFQKANTASSWIPKRDGFPANTIINSLIIAGDHLIAGTENGIFSFSLE